MISGKDIEIIDSDLASEEVDGIIDSLNKNGVRILCLRGCSLSDQKFFELMQAIGTCQTLQQLNCAFGVINSLPRVESLCHGLVINESIRDLFLHSNPLMDEGIKMICDTLINHPRVVSLDVGDCQVEDSGLDAICCLLPSHGKKIGLNELVLSGNENITSMGWAKFAFALAANSSLQSLHLDFNILGDYASSCILVSLAANVHLQHLDLESTRLTQHSADLLLFLLKNYPLHLKEVNLDGNNGIHPHTLESIRIYLNDIMPASSSESFKLVSKKSKSALAYWQRSQALKDLSDLMAQELNETSDEKIRADEPQEVGERVIIRENKKSSTYLQASGKTAKKKKKTRKDQSESQKTHSDIQLPINKNQMTHVKSSDILINETASSDEYEEMEEIQIKEFHQPIIMPWINLTRIIAS